MSLLINLAPDVSERLRNEAERIGKSTADCAAELIDRALPLKKLSREEAAAVFEQWALDADNATDEEIAADREFLRSFDENRTSNRKLFQDILREPPT